MPTRQSTHQQNKSADILINPHQSVERQSFGDMYEAPQSQAPFSFGSTPLFSNSPMIIQPKLRINAPGDRYEQEADRIAEQVIRMPKVDTPTQDGNNSKVSRKPLVSQISPVIQRMSESVEDEEEDLVQTKLMPDIQRKYTECGDKEEDKKKGELLQTKPMLRIQRKCAKCGAEEEENLLQTKPIPGIQCKCAKCQKEEEEEKQTVQTKANGTPHQTASPTLASKIRNTRGHGQALDVKTNAFMSTRFGTDFSRVHIHSDNSAAQMSQEINAQAFTVGRDIYFNQGKYNPGTNEGKKLLAHELTHVVQQQRMAKQIQLSPCSKGQDSFSKIELKIYLSNITRDGIIEDNDSDDKARAIVKCWTKLDKDFILSPLQKVRLIQEMQSGWTGDEDENAILALLEGSDNAALEQMFNMDNGLDQESLDYDLDGAENDRLNQFFQSRFKTKGDKLEPTGTPAKFEECDSNTISNIKWNLPVVRRNLMAAIELLKAPQTSEFLKDSLYLFFRSSSEKTKSFVLERLQNVANQYEKMHFRCHKGNCGKKDEKHLYGFISGNQNPVHICTEVYSKLKDPQHALLHEAMHLFNADITDYGYHGEECKENTKLENAEKPTAGDPPFQRLRNADSYTCFIKQLTFNNLNEEQIADYKYETHKRADSYRGVGLKIGRESSNAGKINIYPEAHEEVREYGFHLENLPEASGFGFEWGVYFDNDSKKYLNLDSNKEKAALSRNQILIIRKSNFQKATIACKVMLYRGGPTKVLVKEIVFDRSKAISYREILASDEYKTLSFKEKHLITQIEELLQKTQTPDFYRTKLYELLQHPYSPDSTTSSHHHVAMVTENQEQVPAIMLASFTGGATSTSADKTNVQLSKPSFRKVLGTQFSDDILKTRFYYYLDDSDPRNIHVKIKIKLTPVAPGDQGIQDVEEIKAQKEEIERVAAQTKGFTLEVDFVNADYRGDDYVEVQINKSKIADAGNLHGSPRVLAHEIFHRMHLDDRYDYIEDYAKEQSYTIERRLGGFKGQLEKVVTNTVDNSPGIMNQLEASPLLLDWEVCTIARFTGDKFDDCIKQRETLK